MSAVRATAFAVLALAAGAAWAAPGDLAAAFAQLGAGRVESRSISLADLGVTGPVVLRAPDASQEFYFPVPVGLPISGATLQLDAHYLRADGGRTTFVLSLDGTPVLARGFSDPQGDGSVSIGVDGAPRPSGFVRVGMQWSSVLNDSVCADQTAIGNLWRAAPTSRLTYQFDTAAIDDVRAAWSALRPAPTLLVAGPRVSPGAYDAAWRIEALLMRAGDSPLVAVLPAVGDTVDLTGVSVPAPLQSVPAFAALASGGTHRIASPAELGALIALAPRGAFAPDVVVSDEALRQRVNAALDALRAQVAGVSADAAPAFDAWRRRAAGALATPLEPGELRLARLGGQAEVVVGDSTGVAALSRTWNPVNVADRLVVHALDSAPNVGAGGDSDRLALALAGGTPRSLNVLTSAEWQASFDLASVSGGGKIPRRVVLELAAAPASSRNGQTASIFFNGVLIGSQLLDTDGRAQLVSAPIPLYALGSINQLRVVFQRQPEGGCQPRAEGYPAAVLPGSYLVLGTASLEDDFTGMVARFSQQTQVLVPEAYLADPAASLPRLARLANAAGVAPTRATFSVAPGDGAAQPAGPFLAADVALRDETARATFDGDRMVLKGRSGNTLADVSGLTGIGVIEVVRAGGQPGVLYRTVGARAPVLGPSLHLQTGDVAVVDGSGTLRQFDTLHAGGVPTTDESNVWLGGHLSSWVLPGAAIVLLLLLIWAAGRARRRRRAKSAAAQKSGAGNGDHRQG
ncbi:cellulose synthase [Burkholderia sp. WAC0059]|nr:cellulose synthase [Burkholderia sp. WAC0059]